MEATHNSSHQLWRLKKRWDLDAAEIGETAEVVEEQLIQNKSTRPSMTPACARTK